MSLENSYCSVTLGLLLALCLRQTSREITRKTRCYLIAPTLTNLVCSLHRFSAVHFKTRRFHWRKTFDVVRLGRARHCSCCCDAQKQFLLNFRSQNVWQPRDVSSDSCTLMGSQGGAQFNFQHFDTECRREFPKLVFRCMTIKSIRLLASSLTE